MDIIKKLTGLKPHQLLFYGISTSILFTEVIVAALSMLFRGRITYDYLITGAVAALLTSFVVVYILISLIKAIKTSVENLVVSEKKYHDLIENLQEVIYSMDMEGNITFISGAVKDFSGYSPDEVIGRHFLDFIYIEDRQMVMAEFKEQTASGVFKPLEIRTVTKSGETRYILARHQPVMKGGRITALSGVFIDITDRKKADEVMRLKELFLDNTIDSVFVNDFDGSFVYLNEAAWKSRGYTKEEMMGMSLRALDTPETARLIEGKMKALMEKGRLTHESAHRCRDGTVMPIEVNARIIEWGGRKHILSTARDISERKKAEEEKTRLNKELSEKMERLERFNRFMVGRELDMVRLKAEVNELLEKAGQPKRYGAPDKIVEG